MSYGSIYVVGDFLEGTLNDMEFDVIVGNPPYQDASMNAKNIKLWSKFVSMAARMSPRYIAYITPEAAFKDVDSNGRKIRKELTECGYGLVEFQRHTIPVFIGVGVATSHWIVSKDSTASISNGVFTMLNDIENSICEKVASYPHKLNLKIFNGHVSRNDLGNTGNLIYFSGKKEAHTTLPVENGGLKLVIPFSASYKNMFITDRPTGMLNHAIPIASIEEGKFIMEYCLSPLLKFVAERYNKTSGFTPFVKNNMVPDLRGMDTSDLYEVFGLHEEERKYVESTFS